MKKQTTIKYDQNDMIVEEGELGVAIVRETRRSDGSLDVTQDFQFCPSLTEQHTSHLTDLNYLIEKYKPDELAQYIAARSVHRTEIIGHDFSKEPDMQEAKNRIYQSKQAYLALGEEITSRFRTHLEFLKFIDNPLNEQKMLKLGLMTQKEVETIKAPLPNEPNETISAQSTTTSKS